MQEIIENKEASRVIGPYSSVRKVGGFLFGSGQSPINPKTGELVDGGITAQVTQVMENIKQLLLAAKLDFADVVKTTVFLIHMEDFTAVNEIYGRYFVDKLPARSCIAVASLPKAACVEIEFIAFRNEQ
ncbi:2-iminobutanoate/2-iminopropanoate deaminase [Sporomusaceae bacterium BoRhaA]|uniref:Rid family detoxifying hydrolase n=1 Tax=Pelorhabdus rhamnosifermentans TaxID=2772457 RepID=UPI001C0605E9|nr:Rid family detoxifying hydrolase [Pelorhabdus rhamnosifermentans]MBU2701745.1 2-iminobutanoate/2-iminopropanoate deaminase [Pelorhabdus rhamnosifermentans]